MNQTRLNPADFLDDLLDRQRNLRLVTALNPIWATTMLILWLLGAMPIGGFTGSVAPLPFLYIIFYNQFGSIRNWWWIRRGPIVPLKDFADVDDASDWLKGMNYSHYQVLTGVFKFYSKKDAVHFKLTWG